MRDYDREWQAACHLLAAPGLADRTRRYIRPAEREIAWKPLLNLGWSTSEHLLVGAALGLWCGTGGDLGRCASLLNDVQYQRLAEAVGLYRGDRPDLATYPGSS